MCNGGYCNPSSKAASLATSGDYMSSVSRADGVSGGGSGTGEVLVVTIDRVGKSG